jgi:hypothetical protein
MRLAAAFFSILLPGFGQIYNKQFVKGIVFVIFEHFDNAYGHINKAIHMDFNGLHHAALQTINFEAMMFYPGFYIYNVWDAWYYAKEGTADKAKTAVPFLIGGFLGEFCVIYSSHLPIPALTTAIAMLAPMVVGMIIYRKS